MTRGSSRDCRRGPRRSYSAERARFSRFSPHSHKPSVVSSLTPMEIMFPHHFRGPLTSANGGYACGRLAAFVDCRRGRGDPPAAASARSAARGCAGRRRRAPPRRRGGRRRGTTRARGARRARPGLRRGRGEVSCGARRRMERRSSTSASCAAPARTGLSIRVGPVAGREPLHASPITLSEALPEIVWAAIDCPGAYAVGAEGRGDIVLGRMTARVQRVPGAGRAVRRHVVAGRRRRPQALRRHGALLRGR